MYCISMASKHTSTGYILAKSDRNSLEKKYFCSLCEKVLRDPVQTNCGHLYCKECYESKRQQ